LPAELSLILQSDALIGTDMSRALAVGLAELGQGMSVSADFSIQQ
jgi:hypothetical protein